jgi:hypothetical protein
LTKKGGKMKISQSKVRVESKKAAPLTNSSVKGGAMPQVNMLKQAPPRPAAVPKSPAAFKKTPLSVPPPARGNFLSHNETAATLQRVLASAQKELELIRRMKAETAQYQQKAASKARSDAHQLVLDARIKTHREIEEIIRQASDEIQKVLADIRVIRITAQEELATQRRFTDAAKLNSISLSLKDAIEKTTAPATEKKPEAVKP